MYNKGLATMIDKKFNINKKYLNDYLFIYLLSFTSNLGAIIYIYKIKIIKSKK